MQIRIRSTIIVLTALTAFYACKKSGYEMRAGYVDLSNKAFVRFLHAAPSFRIQTGQKDSFNLYVDGARLNGTILTYGAVFPAAGTSSYAIVDAGIKTYKLSIAGVVNPDSITLANLGPDTLQAGTKRVVIITDSGAVRLNDVITIPLTGLYNLRFVNLVVNDTAGKTVDIFSTRRNSNIFTNVKPFSPTNNIVSSQALAYNSQLNDTLFVRRSGTTINLASGTLATGLAYQFLNQRTYTLIYRGDGNVTTGTKARTLSVITNQ